MILFSEFKVKFIELNIDRIHAIVPKTKGI